MNIKDQLESAVKTIPHDFRIYNSGTQDYTEFLTRETVPKLIDLALSERYTVADRLLRNGTQL